MTLSTPQVQMQEPNVEPKQGRGVGVCSVGVLYGFFNLAYVFNHQNRWKRISQEMSWPMLWGSFETPRTELKGFTTAAICAPLALTVSGISDIHLGNQPSGL